MDLIDIFFVVSAVVVLAVLVRSAILTILGLAIPALVRWMVLHKSKILQESLQPRDAPSGMFSRAFDMVCRGRSLGSRIDTRVNRHITSSSSRKALGSPCGRGDCCFWGLATLRITKCCCRPRCRSAGASTARSNINCYARRFRNAISLTVCSSAPAAVWTRS